VLESRSGIVIHQYGLPAPTPQMQIYDCDGCFVARCDFGRPEFGVAGEADGMGKYANDPVRVLQAEKDRQARLEALGLVVVVGTGGTSMVIRPSSSSGCAVPSPPAHDASADSWPERSLKPSWHRHGRRRTPRFRTHPVLLRSANAGFRPRETSTR
jgi:hypothetical protein